MSRAIFAEDDYAYCTIESDPEKLGFEQVALIDTGGSYEFDMTLVVRDKTDGKLYWGQDSGCSCPTPFESFNHTDTLKPLPETYDQLFQAITSDRSINLGDGIEFLRKVEDAIAKKWAPARTEADIEFRITTMNGDGQRAYTSDGFDTYEAAVAWINETVVGGLYPNQTFEIRKVYK